MTYYGTVKDGVIVLNEGQRLPEGMSVTIEPSDAPIDGKPQRASIQAMLDALRQAPPVDRADVDELQRLIREDKYPVKG